jgi:DMSO/TMAO reductase YedYZ heme-binding membrane subunit
VLVNSQFWWYVARSGGVVAWALATASVLWGLFLSSRVLGERSDARKLLDLHRFLGGLTVVFTFVHVIGLVLEDSLDFTVVDVLVPMASDWEPAALAWGIVSFYLVLAVEVTSLFRDRVSDRVWQYVHYGGFGVFLFGTIHGLRVGTDVDNPLIWWPAALASAGVVGLCAYRIFSGDPVRVPARQQQVSASVLERTLSQLEQLDTSAYPAAVPPPAVAPMRGFEPLPRMGVPHSAAPPAAPVPPVPPASPPQGDLPLFPARHPSPQPGEHGASRQPPMPTRAPYEDAAAERPLPTRVPQRLTATTAPAAGLGAWAPSARSSSAASMGPPPPPEGAIDPATGEPDPHAYRKWLRDWLEYVETQP